MTDKHTPRPWVLLDGKLFDMEKVVTTQNRVNESDAPICEMNVEYDGEHGAPLRLLAGAVCSLLIPAVIIGTAHVPPEHQLGKARVRCAARTWRASRSDRLDGLSIERAPRCAVRLAGTPRAQV